MILVLGSHFPYTSNFPKNEYGWVFSIFDGNLGVRIFFVLSGFLISFLLIREADKYDKVNLFNFYIRRVFRILPISHVYIITLALLAILGLYSDKWSSWLGCLTFTRNMVGQGRSATVHYWSLAIEEQFYLVWPVVFALLKLWNRPRLFFLTLLLPIVLCFFVRSLWLSDFSGGGILARILGERSILVYADSLAVGCIGAFLALRTPINNNWRFTDWMILAIAIGSLMVSQVLDIHANRWLASTIRSTQAWLILILIWMTIGSRAGIIYTFLNYRPIALIGKLSYSLYVWHLLFISHFMGPNFDSWITHDWKFWLIPTFAVSIASYVFLEMPLVRVRSKFRSTPNRIRSSTK